MEYKDDATIKKEVIETFLKGREEAEKLINNGIDVNIKTPRSLIKHAISQGNADLVTFLLDNGAEISEHDAMYAACTSDQEDVVLLLLDRFARGNIKDHQEALEYCLTYFIEETNKFEIIEQILSFAGSFADYGQYCYYPLLVACEAGDERVIHLLLDKGADLSRRDKEKGNALHCAARSKNSDLVEWLVTKKGFKVNEVDGSGNNALSFAVRHNNTNVVQVLLKHGAKCNISNCKRWTSPLHSACEDGNEAIVKLIIEAGVKINEKCEANDYTPLQIATEKGHANIVEFLLNSGAKITTARCGGYRESLLHMAVKSQKKKLVELFLERGLRMSRNYEKYEVTALELACRYDNCEIIKLFSDHVADINDDLYVSALKSAIVSQKEKVVKLLLELATSYNINLRDANKQLEDLIHSAAKSGNKNIVEILIEEGFDFNCKDERGHSVLYNAFCSKDVETINVLLNKGARIEEKILQASVKGGFKLHAFTIRFLEQGLNINWRKDTDDFSALELSVDNFELFQTLWKYGGSVDSKGKGNVPLLNFACYSGNINVVKFLLNRGADMTATDPNGINCLIAAVDGGNLEVVRMLLEKGMDLVFRDSFGRTALTAALTNYEKQYKYNIDDLELLEDDCFKDNPEYLNIVEFLLDYGATLDINNQNDCENFLFTCENEDLSKLKLVLAYNFDIDVLNKQWTGLINLSNWSKSGKIITQYVVKAQSEGALIVEKILQGINENADLLAHKIECQKEIKLLKEQVVDNSAISFYSILTTTDLNQLVEYSMNIDIHKAFSVHYKVASVTKAMFPMYYDEMRYQIKKGLWRKYLLNQIVATEEDEALSRKISASNRELQAQNNVNKANSGVNNVFVNYES